MDENNFSLHRGSIPLLLSLPHDGSEIPAELAARMQPESRSAPDTDWFVSRLYAFARDMGASLLVPRYPRYVVDLNRPPDDTSLYPGQNTTGLCPAVRFDGQPVYLPGREPSPEEVAQRVRTYWQPYHQALQDELARQRAARRQWSPAISARPTGSLHPRPSPIRPLSSVACSATALLSSRLPALPASCWPSWWEQRSASPSTTPSSRGSIRLGIPT